LKPDVDIRIEFSGIRPGEKLYEELSGLEEDTVPTGHSQIRVFTGRGASADTISRCLEELRRATEARDAAAVVLSLKDLAPDYNPSSFLLRRAFKARVVVA
jgi:FlaA1/EpsC-like NDP-sugar epimerase